MNTEHARKFGAWLRQKRLDRGLSMPQLAVLVKTNKQTINRWEKATPQSLTGKPSIPKREDVIELATALCTDPDEALLIAGYAPINSPLPPEIALVGFDGLSKEDFQRIADYMILLKKAKKS